MTTLPSRSRMCALISPTCSLTSDSIDCSPERIRARVSRTHVGQSESVVRGQPSWRLRALAALEQRRRRPLRLKRLALEPPVDRLKRRPGEPGAARQREFDRLPHVHRVAWLARAAIGIGSCGDRRDESARNISQLLSCLEPRCARTSSSSAARSVFRGPSSESRRERRRSRNLVRREPARRSAGPSDQRRRQPRDDAGDDLLAALRVRRRQHAGIVDAGHRPQHVLDFVRLHLPAGDVHERRDPPAQRQPAVGVARAVVAGQKAAVAEAVSACRRDTVATARCARGPVRALGASSSGRSVTSRPAAAADGIGIVRIVVAVEGDAAGLRRAVERMDLHAESARGSRGPSRAQAVRPPKSERAGRRPAVRTGGCARK